MPAMIFSSVDLPVPFGPTTPILAPWRKDKVTLSRTTLSPSALRTLTKSENVVGHDAQAYVGAVVGFQSAGSNCCRTAELADASRKAGARL